MKNNSYFLILIFSFFHQNSDAQEQLVPLDFNPVIHQYLSAHGNEALKQSVSPDTLTLPFIDDFSEDGIYPSTDRWTDNKVFINSDMARNMPTVGVATFDGLNELGNPYMAGSTLSGPADVLTSKLIYLHSNGTTNYLLTDSIYVSFFYEKKGYGDAPDATDSLILEFNTPGNSWTREWFVKGGVSAGQDTVFTRVDVLVTNAAYLVDGFRFRFRSYGNVSGNLDHWHLDYVRVFSYLATGTKELRDVAFLKKRPLYLNTYTSVPWTHYKNSASSLLPDSTTLIYVNYNNLPRDIGFNHRSYDINGGMVGSFGAPFGNIFSALPANQNLRYTYPMGYAYSTIPEISSDSNYFDFYDYFSNLGNANNAIRSNDTIHYRQNFYNFYSYDDGTCEVAYDLINSPSGKVAMRFNILQSDILRGVQIFFAKQNSVVNNIPMTLKVWSSLSPETIILSQSNMYPSYVDSINGFATYVFNSSIVVPVTFYIGFQHTSTALNGLHLGFDRNTTNNSLMFSNISGVWSQVTAAQGTFMMRPFLGDSVTSINEVNATTRLFIYPNPSRGVFKISSGINRDGKSSISIFDVSGRLVYDKRFTDSIVNISFLTSGIYFVQLRNEKTSSRPERIIIY